MKQIITNFTYKNRNKINNNTNNTNNTNIQKFEKFSIRGEKMACNVGMMIQYSYMITYSNYILQPKLLSLMEHITYCIFFVCTLQAFANKTAPSAMSASPA